MNSLHRQQVINNLTRQRNNVVQTHSPSNWVNCDTTHVRRGPNTRGGKSVCTRTRPQLANFARSSLSATIPTSVIPGVNHMKQKIKLAVSRRPPMYKKWKRVAEFHDSKEAEQSQVNYEGCLWGRRQTRDTKFGLNQYFQCKGIVGSPQCQVYLYLRYLKNGTEVHLFRTENDHTHSCPVLRSHNSSPPQKQSKCFKTQQNGEVMEFEEVEVLERTSATVQDIERACYTNWKRRSSDIEHELKTSYGRTEVDRGLLNEVLRRIRHEFGDKVYNSDNDDDVVEIKLETEESTQEIQQQEQKVQENSQDFVSPIVDFDYSVTDEEDITNLPNPNQAPLNEKVHENDSILNRGMMIVTEIEVPYKSNNQQHVNSTSTNKITLDKTPKITSVTSLSVTNSNSSSSQMKYQAQDNASKPSSSGTNISKSKPKFSCRDESKDQGEICLPDEEDIKASVLKYIDENYSNRDILHVREELRLIRSERKYPAMYRLASFTTGFLQDAFLGDHLEDKKE